MDEKQVKLVEAMGWVWHQPTDERKKLFDNGMGRWEFKGMYREWSTKEELPVDPFTDANDCEALIQLLNEQGWIVNVDWSSEHSVKIWRFRNPDTKEFTWQGNDWKQGVCELALMVLED